MSRVLPVAILVMVLLLAFIIVWMLMHRSASSSAVTTPTSTAPSSPSHSTSAPTSTAGSPAPTSTGVSAAPTTSTTTLTSTATAQANGADSSPASQSAAAVDVTFPADTVSRCGSDAETTQPIPIGDDKVRLPSRQDQTSCSFVREVARQSRERLSQPSTPADFTLDVYSAHRDDLIRAGKLAATSSSYVPLDCTVSNAVAHCVSSDSTDSSKVSIWVAN